MRTIIETGKSYRSKGKGVGTVIGWIAQMNMWSVKYENGEHELVNKYGDAVLRDNINANEYDLLTDVDPTNPEPK